MTFMRKFLDMLNMENWGNKENNSKSEASIEKSDNHEEVLENLQHNVKRKEQKIKEKDISSTNIDITQYAVMCNAHLEHQEEMEQYGIKYEESQKENNDSKSSKQEQPQYEYVLFSRFINTDAIVGSRRNYMRIDYTIDNIFYESHQYIYKLWKLSTDLNKAVKPKKFFELIEEIEKELKSISKYNYPKFNPEKEKGYYFRNKDEMLIDFLNRSFTDEYREALELKTAKGKINRIGNWFSVIDYYKHLLTPNAMEAFEKLADKWQFEILPSLLEPENMKEV